MLVIRRTGMPVGCREWLESTYPEGGQPLVKGSVTTSRISTGTLDESVQGGFRFVHRADKSNRAVPRLFTDVMNLPPS